MSDLPGDGTSRGASRPRRPAGRRRDRHGRGMRGPLARPPVPIARTRRERFDDLVADAVDEVAEAAAAHGLDLRAVVAVAELPPPGRVDHVGDMPVVPLGDVDRDEDPPELVVYRRPVEVRAHDDEELADLVHEVVVDLVADLLDVDPELLED